MTYYVDYTNGIDANNGESPYYPFKTIDHAVSIAVNGDTIYMGGGLHYRTTTLTISGFTGITILPYAGETPVITSRVNLSGWTLYSQSGNIWRCSAQGLTNVVDLIVNNKRSFIAQQPISASGWTQDSSGYSGTGAQSNGWANPQLMWLRFYHPVNGGNVQWTMSEMGITSITSSRINVDTTAMSYYQVLINDSTIAYPSHICNALEALESNNITGQHYIDTVNNYVYYRPNQDENMASIEAWIPTVDETLVEIMNSSNVTFGVTVADSTSYRPLKTGGYIELQGMYFDGSGFDFPYSMPGGLLEINNCTTVNLTGVRIYHAGATGIWCHNSTTGVTLDQFRVYDSGAHGVNFGAYHEDHLGTPSGSSTIERGSITYSGGHYKGGSHFIAPFCTSITLQNMKLGYNYYSAIQFPGGWGDHSPVTGGGHTISGINIVEFMMDDERMLTNQGSLSDGGAIYFNNFQNSTTVTNIYAYRSSRVSSAYPQPNICNCIYFDNDCTGVTVSNVISDGTGIKDYIFENGNLNTPYNSVTTIYFLTGQSIQITHTTVTDTYGSSSPSTNTVGSPTAPTIIGNTGLPSGYTKLDVAQLLTPPQNIAANYDFAAGNISGTTIYDTTGGVSLTTSGTPTYGTGPGILVSFLGVANRAAINTGGFYYYELSFWINPTSLPVFTAVIYNGNGGSNGEGFLIGNGSSGSGSRPQIFLGGIAYDAGGCSYNLTAGTWTHVSFQRQSSSWYVYINGALYNSGTSDTPNSPETGYFQFGDGGNRIADPWLTAALSSNDRAYIYALGGQAPVSPYFIQINRGILTAIVSCERAVNAATWNLYRSTDNVTFTKIQSGSSIPLFTDTTGTIGTTYYYTITAVNPIGESSQSPSAAITLYQLGSARTSIIEPGRTATINPTDTAVIIA